MKWILISLAVIIGGIVYHTLQSRSQIFWQQVGPNTDKALNPDTHNN